MQGRIIKGIAGFYYVYDVVESVIYECRSGTGCICSEEAGSAF